MLFIITGVLIGAREHAYESVILFQYPLTQHKSLFIKPGFVNQVGIDATHVSADPAIKDGATPLKRDCYFPDEVKLKFHRSYSGTYGC